LKFRLRRRWSVYGIAAASWASAERAVRRRLEREGVSGCRERTQQRQQGKSKLRREQGKAPSRRWRQGKAAAGGSRGQQLAAAAAQWSLDVRGGRETLDLRQRRLWCSNQETAAAGNPSPTLPCTVVSWATTQMEKTAHTLFIIRQGPFMILLFHSYTFVNLSVKEL
jgi:hypothetical protein